MIDPSLPKMTFDNDHCFLCGELITDSNRSEEHIFPKWLQNRYSLWDHTIRLINDTYIPYRKLTIPCCTECNGTHLGQMERDIREAVEQGIKAFRQLPEIRVYQWMAKVFYGILFREMSLHVDRTDPEKGFITSPEFLEQLNALHLSMQSVRCHVEFVDFKPWSIFIIKTYEYGDDRDFDYIDNLEGLVFAIRMGEIGIIASLQDIGAEEQFFGETYEQYLDAGLHPVQFDELTCHVIYHSVLKTRVPTFLSSVTLNDEYEPCGPIQIRALPSLGLSSQPLHRQWSAEEFAQVLFLRWSYYGISQKRIFHPPDTLLTFLNDEEGKFRRMEP